MFDRIETKNRSQLAAEMLLKVIKKQKFKIGDKLPPEREIAEKMGVSRNTLREAIAVLQIMGILKVKRSQGIFVVGLGQGSNVTKTIGDIFSNEDPFAVIEARIAFEPGAAAMAANHVTDQDLNDLEQQLDRIRSALKGNNEAEYINHDRDFHLLIARCTNNFLIINTINSLLQAMTQPLWRTMKNDLKDEETAKDRILEHEAIFHAIHQRNEAKTQEALRIHLENSKSRFYLEPRKV